MAMETIMTDVLIIGSGGAGLRCAIELSDKKTDCLVVGKCKKRDAHTILARGGINAALGTMDSKDTWQIHAADTLQDGGMLNEPYAVEILCKNAPLAIKELAKWGCPFHREKNGKISQRFFGAARYRRACFVGDITGEAILNTLVDQVVTRKIPFRSEVYIFHLLKEKKKVVGALGLDMRKGKVVFISAKAVVLATGGHSRMFKRSSSRMYENNGDGIHLAYSAGCRFMDMELFQFHPTGMVWPREAEGTLATEAIRGEGGILTNRKGERYMEHYDPERMELSARDIVARANYMEVISGRGSKRGGVYLDISHLGKKKIMQRLPFMYKQFRTYCGIDISKDKMEVAPTAHYSMGGIFTDHKTGATDVSGLYAIGEITSGVHGGNRLGGNSLAEICVFGRLTGAYLAKKMKSLKRELVSEKELDKGVMVLDSSVSSMGRNPTAVKKEIQKIMWEACGVVRNGKDLRAALSQLKNYKHVQLKTGNRLGKNAALIEALDVSHMYITCSMILESALMRKESRAAHTRTDYPKTLKSWEKNILCIPTRTGFSLKTKKRDPISKSISKYFRKDRKEYRVE